MSGRRERSTNATQKHFGSESAGVFGLNVARAWEDSLLCGSCRRRYTGSGYGRRGLSIGIKVEPLTGCS